MSDPHLSFELAKLADAPAIAELSRDLIETGLGWSWTPTRVAREILDRESLVLVVKRGRLIVGFAIMQFGDEVAHLSLFAVRHEWQRKGVGTTIFDWLRISALTAGIAVIRVELRASNRGARRFYRSLGFEETGISPAYYRGRETALRMQLQFRQTTLGHPS